MKTEPQKAKMIGLIALRRDVAISNAEKQCYGAMMFVLAGEHNAAYYLTMRSDLYEAAAKAERWLEGAIADENLLQ